MIVILKHDAHLNSCIKNTSGKLFVLGIVRANMDKKTARNTFKSLVLPYLEYGSGLLLGCNQANRTKLQRIVNQGLKMALKTDTVALKYYIKRPGWQCIKSSCLGQTGTLNQYHACDECVN